MGEPVADFTYILEKEKYGTDTIRVCALDASTSTAPAGTIASYSWTDGTTVKTGQRVTYYYTEDTTKTFTLTITDSNGATSSCSREIAVSDASGEMLTRALVIGCPDGVHVSLDGGVFWSSVALEDT